MKHICDKCGNTEKFHATAREYHTWVVDGNKDFIEDAGFDDVDNIEIKACAKCGADKIRRTD